MKKIEGLLLAENKEEEEFLLKEIVREDPTNIVACLKLGDIMREKGQYVDALKLHKSVLIDKSRISSQVKKKIYVSIIKDYLGAGKLKSVLQFADELQKLERENIELLKFLGTVYEELSQWEEVIQLKQRILKLTGASDDRGLAILCAVWGNSLLKAGNKKDALKYFREALKLDNLCLLALLFIGDLYYGDGEVDESIKNWEKILDNIPDYAFLAFERLENAYFAKHEVSKLESLYVSFLNRYPENVKVLISFSEIYEKKGQDKEAIELLEKAREIEPKNPKIRTKLMKLYYDNKQYDRVLEEGQRIAEIVDYKAFKCLKCGSQFDEFKFKCPTCKSYLTIR